MRGVALTLAESLRCSHHVPMQPYGPPSDLEREYNALLKQLDAGHYTDPNEIWDMIKLLIETTGYDERSWAERLGRYLPRSSGD